MLSLWNSVNIGNFFEHKSVAYGAGKYVITGTGNIATSSNGIDWTVSTALQANSWDSVVFGNGLFVTVANSGTNQVMTSPDGINWTLRTAASNNYWTSITYGNGLFVAVSSSGTGNRVMTSPDGINWTSRASASDNDWTSITYGNGLFVAVSTSGTKRIMKSVDGITWTLDNYDTSDFLLSVGYGNNLFIVGTHIGTAIHKATDISPTLTNFSIPVKNSNSLPFTIIDPSSNSTGSFSYISSNTSVADISGNLVNINNDGNTTITAKQSASYNYTEGSISTVLVVNVPKLNPSLSNFSFTTKTVGEQPILISNPSSDSTGSFSYTSSDISVADISGNKIIIYGAGTTNITATQEETTTYNQGSITAVLTVNPAPIGSICFPAGTPIKTDQGIINIDKLNPSIHTIRNKQILYVTKTITEHNHLICFKKNSLGNNIPSQDTFVSKNHKVLCNGKMIKAKDFINKSDNIYTVKYKGELLYNILMNEHDRIIVNNMICETLDPNHRIAIIYKALDNLLPYEQKELINICNKCISKKK